LKEFSEKATLWSRTNLMFLNRSSAAGPDDVMDDDTYSFLKEIREELKKEESEGKRESNFQKIMRERVQKDLNFNN
jgi:hypothetical protein